MKNIIHCRNINLNEENATNCCVTFDINMMSCS